MKLASSAGILPVASITALLLWAATLAHAGDDFTTVEPPVVADGLPAQGSQQGVSAVERERETLALIVNRLAHIGREAGATGRIVRSVPPQFTRYHFDYAQLQADLTRIEKGIHAYLNPTRTQPRDVGVLPADYTHEALEGEEE
ncbi:MAG: RAQPRD family integrative conjugative element protein [Proteobacteria bacterium]|nr:RAQPRD family integrative conjugative element protein [Pseudomonadota bacterium]